VPLFSVSKPCSACSKVFMRDIYGDHAVSCAGIVGIKHRHNVVRDTLVDICYRSGISSGKEVNIGLSGERDKSVRLADVLLYSWNGGRDRKRAKYETKCANIGYGFLSFSFSSFGELEKDAVTLLKWIRKFSVAQDIGAQLEKDAVTLLKRIRKFSVALDIGARAAIHIFSRICFAIAKGVGAQIVSRLPSNLL
ncbi:hypothetical protein Tco_1075250, partial [Tanacetum coccineum]